jgi:hypothetical protein
MLDTGISLYKFTHQFELMLFWRLGLNRRKLYRTKIWYILPENQIAPKYTFIEINRKKSET